MRQINICEEDQDLFMKHITDDEFIYYAQHKDAFRCMWKEQGRVFWAYTVTKFRLCMLRYGHLHPFIELTMNGALDSPFILICEKMTGKYGEVTQLVEDINVVSMNRHLVKNMTKPSFSGDPFVNPVTRNAFRNLFGQPDDKRRIQRTYLFAEVFCAWGGTLMRLLERWVNTPAQPWWLEVTNETFRWEPASFYVDARLEYPATLYEKYLKQRWSDNIAKVCGASSSALVWWSKVQSTGSYELPPLEEFRSLSVLMEILTKLLEPRSPLLAAATGGVTNLPDGPPSSAAAGLGGVDECLLGVKTDAKTARNRRKKERKKQNLKAARQAANIEGDGDASAKERADSTASKADKPTQKPARSSLSAHPPEVLGRELAVPAVGARVTEATLDWHQYWQLCTDPLQRQLLGGQLVLGWIGYMLKDCMYYLVHLEPSEMSQLQSRQESLSAQLVSLKKVVDSAYGDSAANKGKPDVSALRKSRDELTTCIKEMRQTLLATYPLRVTAGPEPQSELRQIRQLVQRALQSPLLYAYPTLLQYSLTEAPEQHAHPRHVYPDMSRIRHCIRKGAAFVAAAPPLTAEGRRAAVVAALDWYRELVALPGLLQQHVTTHAHRPDGTILRRIAQPRPCKQRHESMDLTDPGAEFGVILWSLEELSKLTVEGSCLPRLSNVDHPHCAQSVVDFFWAKLGAMAFLVDLMGFFCCCWTLREAINTFKNTDLWDLMGTVLNLQLAQCRWLHPRAELELPKRPALERAAGRHTWNHYLSVAAWYLDRTHYSLQALLCKLRTCDRPLEAPPSPEEECATLPQQHCWHLVHYENDMCGHACVGCGPGPCKMRLSHTLDTNFRLIATMVHGMMLMEARCAMEVDRSTDYFTDSLLRWHTLAEAHARKLPMDAAAIEKICLTELTQDNMANVLWTANRMQEICRSIGVTNQQVAGFEDSNSLWKVEYLEANLRFFLMRLPCEFRNTYRSCVEQRHSPNFQELNGMLNSMAAKLNLDVNMKKPAPQITLSKPLLKPSPATYYGLRLKWPNIQKKATEETHCFDWRRWVVDAAAAGPVLSRGRTNPDQAACAPCVRHLGSSAVHPPCNHDTSDPDHPNRRLCLLLSTLRNIKYIECVLSGIGPGAEVSVHRSLWRLLTEAWLPALLAWDRLHAGGAAAAGELHSRHSALLRSTAALLDGALADLYLPRSKFGAGRMERADRAWLMDMDNRQWIRPDVTVCRTISWTQAVDMHMALMEKIVRMLCVTRLLVPPLYDKDGREVHVTPLALLARAEVGALLLLRAFLPHRDGQRAAQLVDVSELPEDVALALDLRAWFQLQLAVLEQFTVRGAFRHMHAEPPAELAELVAAALREYERPLRFGSLLEFLALRQVHAAPLVWVVRAYERTSRGQQHASVVRTLADRLRRTPAQLFLPPIHELRWRAARASPPSLPAGWTTRLAALRNVLRARDPPPRLLQSALFSLDYQLDFGSPKLPEFQPAHQPSAEQLFGLDHGDPVGMCDHVYKLGEMLLQRQADGLMYDYRARQDHITAGVEPFVKPFCNGPGPALKKAAKMVKRVPVSANCAPTATVEGQDAATSTDAIDSLAQQLSSLLLSKDQAALSNIPEEPVGSSALKATRRRVAKLIERLNALPDDNLKWASLSLIMLVQDQLTNKNTVKLTGSDMSLIDVCLDRLSKVVDEAVTESSDKRDKDALECKAKSANISKVETDETTGSAQQTVSSNHSYSSKPAETVKMTNGTETESRCAGAGRQESVASSESVASERPARCGFCGRPGTPAAPLQLCSLCVQARVTPPRAYCGRLCQTDDWQVGHWEDHQ